MAQVIRRAAPPVLRMVRGVVSRVYDGWFAVLGSSGTVEIEAVDPDTRPIQHLASVVLIARFRRCGQV